MNDGKPIADAGETTVFVSYSRKDRDAALPVIRLLESAGFATWWDGVLEGGVRYVESTEDALETAKAVVVLWSASSAASHWVRDEAMSGRERACLVPVSLDGSQPPLGFRQFQIIDFAGWKGKRDTPEAQQLLRAVSALHGTKEPAPATPAPAKSPVLSRRGVIALGAGAVALSAGGALWWMRGGGTAGVASGNGIAVLPFNNDSADPDLAYLSDGLSAELRAILARNPALRVVARSTSETMKNSGLDAMSIARELGVAFIVEGAVRVSGDTVRVTSDLIEGDTGLGRWSQTYDQAMGDLLDLHKQLASTISAQLSEQVSAAGQSLDIGEATVPAAFDAYLKGWSLYASSNSTETDLEVLSLFERAVRLDPGYAAARAGEAAALMMLGNTADDAGAARGYYDRALAAARTAVELGPDLDEAHSVLALVLFDGRLDVAGARASYERALELGGGSAGIQARFAEYCALTGQDARAASAIGTAQDLDPLNPSIFQTAGLVDYAARRFKDAIAGFTHALELYENAASANSWIAKCLYHLGRSEEAVAYCEQENFNLMRNSVLAIVRYGLGNGASAQAAMDELIAEYGDAGLYQQAQVRAQWGEPGEAMAALQKARGIGDAGLTYLAMDPMLDPLRSRRDFGELTDSLGFVQAGGLP